MRWTARVGCGLLLALGSAVSATAQARMWSVRLSSGALFRNVLIVSVDGDQLSVQENGQTRLLPLVQVTEVRSSPVTVSNNTLDRSTPVGPLVPGVATSSTPGGATPATASNVGVTDSAASRQTRLGGFILPDTSTVLYQFTSYDLAEKRRVMTALAHGLRP